MECLAPSTLRKGPVIIYVEGGGGGGERNTCWEDQNFCKAPPADHLNSKWPPYFIQYLRDDPPTHTHTHHHLTSLLISSSM